MTDTPRVIALIPARAGSKGVPMKNIKPLPLGGGPSCVERAIACAQASGVCDRIVVSTNDGEAMRQASQYDRVLVHHREPWAATDEAPMLSVIMDLWKVAWLDDADIVLILQPSSPLRRPRLLREVVDTLHEGDDCDSVVTVQPIPGGVDKAVVFNEKRGTYLPVSGDWRTRHQDVRPAYRRDGQLYGFRMEMFLREWDFYGPNLGIIVTDPADALSIDTPEDWADAERRLRKREVLNGLGTPADGPFPAYTEGDPARFESCLPKWRSDWPQRVRSRQDEVLEAIRQGKTPPLWAGRCE